MSHYVTRALAMLVDAVEPMDAVAPFTKRAEQDLHNLPKVPILFDAAKRAMIDATAKMRAEGVNVSIDTHAWEDVRVELQARREIRLRAIAFRKARDEQRAAELATYAI